LDFTLFYADTMQPVDMLQRNRYRDTFNLMTPTGPLHDAKPVFLNHFGVHTTKGVPVSQRDPTVFDTPWTTEMLGFKEEADALELSMRFSTNITSHTHNERRFYWQAELNWGMEASALTHTTRLAATSHIFDYRPRPPPSTERPHLSELVCDGRAGDLLHIIGARIGDEYDDVTCELVDAEGRDYSLERAKASKHAFVARLPELPAGCYKVQMRLENAAASNALNLEILMPGSPPATPPHEPQSPKQPSQTQDLQYWDIPQELLEQIEVQVGTEQVAATASAQLTQGGVFSEDSFAQWLSENLDGDDTLPMLQEPLPMLCCP